MGQQQSFDFDRLQQRLDDAYITVMAHVDALAFNSSRTLANRFEFARRSLGQKTRYAISRNSTKERFHV